MAAQRPAPSTCSLALRQALPVEQVLFPAFGISPNLGPAREAGTWRGEVVRLLALWEERWREAEGTQERSSHEGSSWNGQSQPEVHGLTQGRCSRGRVAHQGMSHSRAKGLPDLKWPHHAQPCFDALCIPYPLLQQDGRTQGFMEPAERVTQALSASRVTWIKHFSLE